MRTLTFWLGNSAESKPLKRALKHQPEGIPDTWARSDSVMSVSDAVYRLTTESLITFRRAIHRRRASASSPAAFRPGDVPRAVEIQRRLG
jgi:hypothetical protein